MCLVQRFPYDLMLKNDGKAQLYLAMANMCGDNLDANFEILKHDSVVPGLGDGGAHCGTICDASYSTFLLTAARERKRGNTVSLPLVVQKLTSASARVLGLMDRGVIAPGYKADLNVIDFDAIKIFHPEVSHDLPGGGRRLIQKAEGYRATIVNGIPTYLDGQPTGRLPGRLIRGSQAGPSQL